MLFLSVPPLSVTCHLWSWLIMTRSQTPQQKPYILYPPFPSFLCYPMPSNAMRSCCCSWDGIGKWSEKWNPSSPTTFFQCHQFLIIHLFLLTYWLPTLPSNYRLDESWEMCTLCWSGCASVNTKYFNLWNTGVNVREGNTLVGISAHPQEVKWKQNSGAFCLIVGKLVWTEKFN